MIIESRIPDTTREVRSSELQGSSVQRQRSVTSKSNSGSTRKPFDAISEGSTKSLRDIQVSMPDPIDVHIAIEKLNKMAEAQKKDVSFSIDKDSDATVIKVFKRTTGELIKQFPAELVLAMKARFRKDAGWFIDSKF
jgi:uncharacterized FlaG/YvyC family protein